MPAKKLTSDDIASVSITVQHRSLAGQTPSADSPAAVAPSARTNHHVIQPLSAALNNPVSKPTQPIANHSLRPRAPKPTSTAEQDPAEIKAVIESKQYFLPIDAVARRRSTKVSLLLTLLVIALATVLINLMLDSGLVVLPIDIPHTNLFS